jgi:beta-phosphoglucomutase
MFLMSKSCVIFDFDGVIANTEDFHFAAYNHALGALKDQVGQNIQITPQQYFSRYIVYGTFEAFRNMLKDAGLTPSIGLLHQLGHEKDRVMDSHLGELGAPLPGVVRLLDHLKERCIPCGICSGARRSEITMLLNSIGLQDRFPVIVAIEDVSMSKPDPEGYALVFQKLWEHSGAAVEKKCSLVIEDTSGGAAAARAAGLRVIGVATTCPVVDVRNWADFPVNDLAGLDLAQFDQWLGGAAL